MYSKVLPYAAAELNFVSNCFCKISRASSPLKSYERPAQWTPIVEAFSQVRLPHLSVAYFIQILPDSPILFALSSSALFSYFDFVKCYFRKMRC